MCKKTIKIRKQWRRLQIHNSKFGIVILSLVLTLTALLLLRIYVFYNKYSSEVYCYDLSGESLTGITQEAPPKDGSIFFIDASCASHSQGRIRIDARTACVVEAAARIHPDQQIYLLFTSPGVLKFNNRQRSFRSIYALLSYGNVNLHRIHYNKYLQGTPMGRFLRTSVLYNTPNSIKHVSYILRIATLWKYGGIFLELDELVLKNLKKLGPTFLAYDVDQSVNFDVMGMSSDFKGKHTLRYIMDAMATSFFVEKWYSSGFVPLSSVVERNCLKKFLQKKDCDFVKLYSHKLFHPTNISEWFDLFEVNKTDVLKRFSKSYTMKVWNIHIARYLPDDTPHGKLLKEKCPRVYEAVNGYFY